MAGYIWRPKYYRNPKEIPVPVQKNTTAASFYHGAARSLTTILTSGNL